MTVVLWMCYIVGQVLSIWKRADLASAKSYTPWQNVKQYVIAHGPQIGINFLLASGLFWTVWHDTAFLSRMLLYVGIQKDIEVPLNPFTAGIYGIFSDVLMDFIVAKIGNKVPAIQTPYGGTNENKTTSDTGGNACEPVPVADGVPTKHTD